jgi:hypothetical protein
LQGNLCLPSICRLEEDYHKEIISVGSGFNDPAGILSSIRVRGKKQTRSPFGIPENKPLSSLSPLLLPLNDFSLPAFRKIGLPPSLKGSLLHLGTKLWPGYQVRLGQKGKNSKWKQVFLCGDLCLFGRDVRW